MAIAKEEKRENPAVGHFNERLEYSRRIIPAGINDRCETGFIARWS